MGSEGRRFKPVEGEKTVTQSAQPEDSSRVTKSGGFICGTVISVMMTVSPMLTALFPNSNEPVTQASKHPVAEPHSVTVRAGEELVIHPDGTYTLRQVGSYNDSYNSNSQPSGN